MQVTLTCHVCRQTKQEDAATFAKNNEKPIHLRSAKDICICDSCAKRRVAEENFIQSRVLAYKGFLGPIGRWWASIRAGVEFDQLWNKGILQERPANPPKTPPHVNCRCTPFVWQSKPDGRNKHSMAKKATADDMESLAAMVQAGFDSAAFHDQDITMELTYRRVGDLAKADSKIEVLNVRKADVARAESVDVAAPGEMTLQGDITMEGSVTMEPKDENRNKYDFVLIPFMAMMSLELHANSDKGDRPGWLNMSEDECLLEIIYHYGKLQKAVRDEDVVLIREHAADVANLCMILVDICDPNFVVRS